ncbi:hypothetical protein [Streptomyces sp. PvR034]|uniref:hypothetical protein n=1 Tax=Streptomyces sp. PvR034 TaxID=3156401 RepID=UPI0033974762
MRDGIARTLLWVLSLFTLRRPTPQAPGRHSAAYLTHRAATDRTAKERQWAGPSSADARAIFRADLSHLSPEQRERYWATAFAEIGIEYPYRYPGDLFSSRLAAA